MKRAIGMSTGVLYRIISSMSQRIIDLQKSLGSSAIEIGCIRKERLFELPNLNAEDVRHHFSHLSIHAPTDLKYKLDAETKQVMNLIAEAHQRFRFDLVVFHPENVEDWSVFNNLPFPIGIENSDWRKGFGKTVEDIAKVFEQVDVGFVLDVNHCFSNDKTMKLAVEFATRFSGRLREVHLSGFTEYHEPISATRQEEILMAVPDANCPIIIESVCLDEEEVRQELSYVTNYFNRKGTINGR